MRFCFYCEKLICSKWWIIIADLLYWCYCVTACTKYKNLEFRTIKVLLMKHATTCGRYMMKTINDQLWFQIEQSCLWTEFQWKLEILTWKTQNWGNYNIVLEFYQKSFYHYHDDSNSCKILRIVKKIIILFVTTKN